MYLVEKEFTFEAAHRLVAPYEGKCLNLHGHSFKVAIALSSHTLTQEGFVLDFQDLDIIGQWINENLDHAVIASHKDSPLIEYLSITKQRMFLVDKNPTSEVIASVILNKVKNHFPKFKVEVTIHETCRSRVRVSE